MIPAEAATDVDVLANQTLNDLIDNRINRLLAKETNIPTGRNVHPHDLSIVLKNCQNAIDVVGQIVWGYTPSKRNQLMESICRLEIKRRSEEEDQTLHSLINEYNSTYGGLHG